MLHNSSCSLCIDSRVQLHAVVELLPLLLLLLLAAGCYDIQYGLSTVIDRSAPVVLSACHQDQYFLQSASNISFFFEEKALDGAGELQTAKALSINKIGHAMHDLDPVFR